MHHSHVLRIVWLVGSFLVSLSSRAQFSDAELEKMILRQDSLFWVAYNTCDTQKFAQFFSEDVEFYHDKSGPTQGFSNFAAVANKNLCGNPNFRLRREAVPGTVKVFPMRKSNVLYGAIVSGEHLFYIRADGKENLDGLARFTHLWLMRENVWKMTRVLSFDHGPATRQNKKAEIKLADKVLDRCVGQYEGPQTGVVAVSRRDSLLELAVKETKIVLYPESETRFFVKERDLTFEFIQVGNKSSKVLVRENGKIVEELTAKKFLQ